MNLKNSKENKKIKEGNDFPNKKKKEDKLASEISKLSYEESLEQLDKLIRELQNEEIPVEKLCDNYLKGKLYLQHCEVLLSKIEQNIIQLDPITLDIQEKNT